MNTVLNVHCAHAGNHQQIDLQAAQALLNQFMCNTVCNSTCGVDTIMAPERGNCCVMLSCASPVPGGMSITNTRALQSTRLQNVPMALITIGPRQTAASCSFISKPIDMH